MNDKFEQEPYLSDLVKRLRRYDTRLEIAMLKREAADTIERLCATVDWSEGARLRNMNDLLDEAVKSERLQAEIDKTVSSELVWMGRAKVAEAEIERLRSMMRVREDALNQFTDEIERLRAEIERLKNELREQPGERQ